MDWGVPEAWRQCYNSSMKSDLTAPSREEEEQQRQQTARLPILSRTLGRSPTKRGVKSWWKFVPLRGWGATANGKCHFRFPFLTLPLTTFLGWFSQIPCLVGYFQIPWEVTSPSHPLFLPRAVFEWNQRSHRTYNVRSVRRNPLTNYLCLCFIWQHKCTALPDIFLQKMETTFSPCKQQCCHVCASFIWNCDRIVVELVKMYSAWLSINGWKQSQCEWCESVPSKPALWLVAALDSASVER